MRLLIVDDDPLVCESLELLLAREADIDVCGTALHGGEALERCAQHSPDIVLMDIRMPGMDGIQAVREIKQRWPDMRVMMLTTFQDEQNIRSALLAGADGYMLKSTQPSAIAGQLRVLHAGSSVLDADVLRSLAQPNEHKLDELTPREQDIVRLVAQGCSNREIAGQLFIGEGTVRNTLSIVLEKLQLRDRTQLAIFYWRS